MKLNPPHNTNGRHSKNHGERGAALVTMLLVSILLLGAGGALIMTTMMSANNSVGSTAEMQALRERTRQVAGDGRYELYKASLKFDNPQARIAHSFPLDEQSVEVKEMLKATENTGHPFPEITPARP